MGSSTSFSWDWGDSGHGVGARWRHRGRSRKPWFCISVLKYTSHRFNTWLTHEIDRQMPPGFRAAQMCLPGLAGLCSEQYARPSGVWHTQDYCLFSATHLAPWEVSLPRTAQVMSYMASGCRFMTHLVPSLNLLESAVEKVQFSCKCLTLIAAEFLLQAWGGWRAGLPKVIAKLELSWAWRPGLWEPLLCPIHYIRWPDGPWHLLTVVSSYSKLVANLLHNLSCKTWKVLNLRSKQKGSQPLRMRPDSFTTLMRAVLSSSVELKRKIVYGQSEQQ